jgi:hypothetical protein
MSINKVVNVVFGICGLLGYFHTTAWAHPVFTTAPGELIVNQRTGAITYCVTITAGTIFAPEAKGLCAEIGNAEPSAVIPSLVISDPVATSDGTSSFITNIYTGQITQCVYDYSTTGGAAFHFQCLVIGNAATQ